MDIQIVKAEESEGKWIIVWRTITEDDGTVRTYPHRYPNVTLAIRAAEYDLEPDDPRVLDIMLLEDFYPSHPDDKHPLFHASSVAEALAIMEERIETIRNEHGAPKEPQMRSLFHAADVEESTQGLTDAKTLFLKHADPSIGWAVKVNRDEGRKSIAAEARSLVDSIKLQALETAQSQAMEEQVARGGDAFGSQRSAAGSTETPGAPHEKVGRRSDT